MLMCCDEDVIFLGCFQSCEPIQTEIDRDYEEYLRVKQDFNGAVINERFLGTLNDGKLVIPAGLFNEDYMTQFELLTDAGVRIGCYKIKTYPTQTYVQKSIIPTVTVSDYECIDGTISFNLSFLFTAEDQGKLFKNDSFFKVGFIGGSVTEYDNFSNGLNYTTGFIIENIDNLPRPFGCSVLMQAADCSTDIVIYLQSYSNLKDENLILNIPHQIITPS